MSEDIKLINGDAYKEIKKIDDKTIDLILIDPPYDIPNNYTITDSKNMQDRKRANGNKLSRIHKARIKKSIEIKDMSDGIDFNILDEFERISKKLNMFIFCNKTLLFKLITHYENTKYKKYSKEVRCGAKLTHPH